MIHVVRWLLLPVSLLYAAVVWLRNRMYDLQILKSTSFDLPVVVIGNLAVGGTGKSPITEYVLRTLKQRRNIAVVSRGYGRKTKGFRIVKTTDQSVSVGDEPLQIKRKFPETEVIVCEDRVLAIKQLRDTVDGVLLDDAFQHRALKPSFVILLFDYASLLQPILPLPTGNFRDTLVESRRSDVIVVTKCPDHVDPSVKSVIASRLSRYSHSPIFYAKTAYGHLKNAQGAHFDDKLLADTHVLLVTGIANPKPMASYLTQRVKNVKHLRYNDHHHFTQREFTEISNTFRKIGHEQKIIVTTEKDFQRIPSSFLDRHPVYFLPIEQAILFGEAPQLNTEIEKAFQSGSVN
ncbi:MAG TPA: tetraacyldisaccharide 4'-kinase [Sphingobacterium sp.]|nr:tetraacyldisaccharide 4'-kinase [Sphingobacterium sp.]